MDFEENLVKRQNSTEYFDTVIGHIEDIVIGEDFQVSTEGYNIGSSSHVPSF